MKTIKQLHGTCVCINNDGDIFHVDCNYEFQHGYANGGEHRFYVKDHDGKYHQFTEALFVKNFKLIEHTHNILIDKKDDLIKTNIYR